jgi:hypothetical protein
MDVLAVGEDVFEEMSKPNSKQEEEGKVNKQLTDNGFGRARG